MTDEAQEREAVKDEPGGVCETTLYHFTCQDSARRLLAHGTLRPNFQPMLGVALVWLTSDSGASREALGLTSNSLDCDRMDVLYRVADSSRCEPFARWMERNPVEAVVAEHHLFGPGRRPDLWWISERPVRVERVALSHATGRRKERDERA